MICALCGRRLEGFADAFMLEQRTKRDGKTVSEKVPVCRDIDACNERKFENERKRNAGGSDAS